MAILTPLLFLAVFFLGAAAKADVYGSFTSGAERALKFTLTLLPCLAATFMMCELMEASGISAALEKWLSPAFGFLGVPEELTRLILVKPLSGSGSLAYLTDIMEEYGPDDYITRCACVCYGCSDTALYLSAVLFSAAKVKTRGMLRPLLIALFASFASMTAGCALCRIM